MIELIKICPPILTLIILIFFFKNTRKNRILLKSIRKEFKLNQIDIRSQLSTLNNDLSKLKNLDYLQNLSKLSELSELINLRELKQLSSLAELKQLNLIPKIEALSHKYQIDALEIYNQLQSYIDLKELIALPLGIPLLRGWAASPDFLLEISRHTILNKPSTVVECSSGSSTLILAKCLQKNGIGHVFSLEHDLLYAQKTQSLIDQAGLSKWATIIHAPLEILNDKPEYIWYSMNILKKLIDKIDLLVIDGPPGTTCPLARYPALPKLYPFLSKGCKATVFLDDAAREDERLIVNMWHQEHSEWDVDFLNFEKGCIKMTLHK